VGISGFTALPYSDGLIKLKETWDKLTVCEGINGVYWVAKEALGRQSSKMEFFEQIFHLR